MPINDDLLIWMLIREHNSFLAISKNRDYTSMQRSEATSIYEMIRGILHEYSSRTRTTPFWYDLNGKIHRDLNAE